MKSNPIWQPQLRQNELFTCDHRIKCNIPLSENISAGIKWTFLFLYQVKWQCHFMMWPYKVRIWHWYKHIYWDIPFIMSLYWQDMYKQHVFYKNITNSIDATCCSP